MLPQLQEALIRLYTEHIKWNKEHLSKTAVAVSLLFQFFSVPELTLCWQVHPPRAVCNYGIKTKMNASPLQATHLQCWVAEMKDYRSTDC